MSFRQDPFIRSIVRDIVRDCVRPVYGFPALSVQWLLTNVLNLMATVGDDATAGGTSITQARVFDITSGTLIEEVPASVAVSESMRMSFDENEGAIRGANIVVNGDFADGETGWVTPTDVDIVISGGVATWSGDGLLRQNVTLDALSYYEFIWDMSSYTSGTWNSQGFNDQTPKRIDDGLHRDIVYFPTGSSAFFHNGAGGAAGVLNSIEIRKIEPAFVATDTRQFGISGDSIAQNATLNLPSIFPADIGKNGFSLNDASIKITDNALGNQTYAWVLSTGVPNAIAAGAESILIHCGVNDVSTSRTWGQIESDLDDIKALLTGQELFISEILPWTNGSDAENATIRTFNTNFAVWAAANGVTLISTHDQVGQIRVSTGELDDLKTIYDLDGVHLTAGGYFTLWSMWFDSINTALELPIGVKLHPSKQLTENGVTSTVFLVHQAWPGTAQSVDANSFAVGKNGNHWYYFQADSGGGTTGGSEPTWPNTLDATVVDNDITWTNKGRYSNIGPGYLPHVLSEVEATNSGLHARDMTNAAWVKTTMTAAKDQTGFDDVANSASSLLATVGNATCLQTVTLGAADYVTSADIKRLVGTGTIEVTIDGGTTWVDVTANISTTEWYRAEATKNAANPSIGFRIVTDTDKIAVDFSGVEAGTVASSRIPTTTGTVTRDATEFLVTPDTEEYLRLRFADVITQTYLSSGTIVISYDGTDLTVTDGTNAMTHTVAMEVGDQITIVESTGELYYNGSLVDTNASYSPTWGEIALGNAVDYRFDADLDPTDLTWSQP